MRFSIALTLSLFIFCQSNAMAADHPMMDHGDMKMDDMDHSKMDHGDMNMGDMDHSKMDHGAHKKKMEHKMASPEDMRKRMMKWIPKAEAAIGSKIDPNLTYVDQNGKIRKLGEWFDKPLFVAFIFADCPHICPMIVSNLEKRVEAARKKHGDAFRVLTISFDRNDALAGKMKQYGESFTDDFSTWGFGVGEKGKVHQLTDAFGFSFMPHPEEVWAHITMVSAIDKGGVVIKQIYGTKVKENEFNEALNGLLSK